MTVQPDPRARPLTDAMADAVDNSAANPHADPHTGGPASRRLLIVDDDVDFAVSTSRVLALEGVDCAVVHDGAGALALLEREEIEIVLLDIRLRDEDGTELAARLRARHPQLIVIIMTAYASVDSAVASLKAGAYDYLRKPFFLDELLRALERCFQLADLRRDKARAERQLTLLHQIEAASQLAAGLSHDFKNMLAVIRANLTVIDDGLHGRDVLKPYAQDAREAAVTAADLIARLMGFTRGGAAGRAAIDLRDPLGSTAAMLGRTLCRDMDLRLEMPDAPLLAPVDPGQLEAALVNLLINARDATGGRGRVLIRLSHVWHQGDYARLETRDDGPGLTAQGLDRALEPMFTTKPDGTGLGLPMIQQMALRHGGRFCIGNAPEGGARAVLDLPCLDPAPDRPPDQPPDQPLRQGAGQGANPGLVKGLDQGSGENM